MGNPEANQVELRVRRRDEGINLSLRDVAIERTVTNGVIASGVPATLEGVLVRDVALAADPRFARGIVVQASPYASQPVTSSIRGASVQATAEIGIAVLGAAVDIDGVAVIGDPQAEPDNPPQLSAGILAQLEQSTGSPAAIAVTDSLVDGAPSFGVVVLGAEGTIENTHVRATRPSQHVDWWGYGMLVQAALPTQTPAAATIERCLVEQSPSIGIAVVGATAQVAHTMVREAPGVDGMWGDGIVVSTVGTYQSGGVVVTHPGVADIRSTLVEDVARAGLFTSAATVQLGDSMMHCSAIPLNGEPLIDLDFDLVDEGGNHCGCNALFPPCKVLSEGLTAPEPVDPEG